MKATSSHTPYEGPHFILQVIPMQETVIPDLSTHFHLHNDPDLPYLGVIQSKATDDEIAALPEVLKGPDIWRDPRLKNAIFMSDRLLRAISEARLLAPARAIRCRLVARA